MAGQRRAATRRKNGYWTRQAARTARNIRRRMERHAARHPRDQVAAAARRRLA